MNISDHVWYVILSVYKYYSVMLFVCVGIVCFLTLVSRSRISSAYLSMHHEGFSNRIESYYKIEGIRKGMNKLLINQSIGYQLTLLGFAWLHVQKTKDRRQKIKQTHSLTNSLARSEVGFMIHDAEWMNEQIIIHNRIEYLRFDSFIQSVK